jgi:hypothetical protein
VQCYNNISEDSGYEPLGGRTRLLIEISRTVGACLMTNLNKVLAYALKKTGLTFVLVFWEDDSIRIGKLSTIRIKFWRINFCL